MRIVPILCGLYVSSMASSSKTSAVARIGASLATPYYGSLSITFKSTSVSYDATSPVTPS